MTTIQALATRVDSLLQNGEYVNGETDPTLGIHLLREPAPTQFEAFIYEPVACLILQGEKRTTVGEGTFLAAEGHCIVVSHHLPVVARISRASPRRPYLALAIRLELATLRSLYDEVGDPQTAASHSPRSMEVATVDAQTLDVMGRYLDLVTDSVSARVLLPLVRKELHYRLYMSASGGMLRSLLQRQSHASNIAHAIQMLRSSFREPLPVADLARSVGMSTSSFHKHFKSITMTTPLQYQKNLRLTEARKLLRAGGASSVSEAAFEVGYESPSQFSREYARKFGAPPGLELSA